MRSRKKLKKLTAVATDKTMRTLEKEMGPPLSFYCRNDEHTRCIGLYCECNCHKEAK